MEREWVGGRMEKAYLLRFRRKGGRKGRNEGRGRGREIEWRKRS